MVLLSGIRLVAIPTVTDPIEVRVVWDFDPLAGFPHRPETALTLPTDRKDLIRKVSVFRHRDRIACGAIRSVPTQTDPAELAVSVGQSRIWRNLYLDALTPEVAVSPVASGRQLAVAAEDIAVCRYPYGLALVACAPEQPVTCPAVAV